MFAVPPTFDVEDDVCMLPLIGVHDSVIAKEVTFEGEYLPPPELPYADFALLDLPENRTLPQRTPLRNACPKQPEVLGKHRANPAALRCEHCALRFQCRSHLTRHQSVHHRKELRTSFEQRLRDVNQHSKRSVCDICLTTFHGPVTLEWHRKFHLEEQEPIEAVDAYTCDVCRKRCTSSSHLHLHRKVHLEQKPYACGHCERRFSSSGNRQKHVTRVHTHERKYRCGVCEKAFIYPRQLKLHGQREHRSCGQSVGVTVTCEEQRTFECSQCAKRFKQATHLRNHLLTHTGIRAYGCEFCPKRFAMAGDLRIHRRIHTKEKPFRCDRCPAAFIMGKQLNKHRAVVHGTAKT
ncbi:zinc finger protein 239-like [Anopheles bellator]|uniref:zinc finger protein 239-like n=1 Tax=Anopheles bellator TaxID=139047 RepID=UPI0026499B46|nr:zinc finger protein 239-like [Anopheles bellator]